jgi:hypothetical protein
MGWNLITFRLGDKMVKGLVIKDNPKTVWVKPYPTSCVHLNQNYKVIKRHKEKHRCAI